MTHIFNQRPNLPDHRDLVHFEPPTSTAAIPKKFDVWQHFPEIRRWDQADEGSCGGHAQARVVMHELLKAGVTFNQDWSDPDVSPGDRVAPAFAYYTARQIMRTTTQDSGVDNRSLFKALKKYGSVREADMPYVPGQFGQRPSVTAYADALKWDKVSYRSVVAAQGNLRRTILQGNLVVQGFSVPDYFEEKSIWDPATDYLKVPQDVPGFAGFIGGHDVVVSGYDFTCSTWPVPVVILDNSWGDSDWGLAFEAPSGRVGRFAMDARWQGSSNLSVDLTALISESV